MLVAVIGGCVLLAVGAAFFGARFVGAAAAALPAMALAEIGLLGVTYLMASGVLLMREPNFFVDSTNFAFTAASGASFPITILPGALKAVSFLLPTTYALDVLRVNALGTHPLLPAWLEYLALGALAVALVCLGLWVFGRTERRLQQTGSLGQY